MLSLSLNEALRRGAWTCIGCATVPRSPQALMTSPASKQSDPKHQRKYSSSKASSSPKDDTRAITTAPSDETPTEPPAVKRSGGRRSSRATSKPSAIKARLEAYPNIPSVPSTQHLHPMNIHVASFFSRHRPISVTKSFPEAASEAAFSSIFELKTSPKTHPFDVINTVSSAIDSLENAAFQDHEDNTSYSHPKSSRRSNSKVLKHLDSNPNPNETKTQVISLDITDLSKSFRHFVPPPPPVPFADAPSKPTSSSSSKRRSIPVKERTYSTTLTITEHTLPSGEKTYQASVSPVVRSSPTRPQKTRTSRYSSSQSLTPNEVTMIDITPPLSSFPSPPSPRGCPQQPFLERMKKRQQVWEGGLTGKKREMWRAISVKRQRKLKMKKHKYKKLMRKTRNLRRRLDRN